MASFAPSLVLASLPLTGLGLSAAACEVTPLGPWSELLGSPAHLARRRCPLCVPPSRTPRSRAFRVRGTAGEAWRMKGGG